MAVSKEEIARVVEAISPFGESRGKAMFGGAGVYLDERLIIVIDDGEVFFKTNKETTAEFADKGGKQWGYMMNDQMNFADYWTIPAEDWNSPATLEPWVRKAFSVAKPPKPKAPKKPKKK